MLDACKFFNLQLYQQQWYLFKHCSSFCKKSLKRKHYLSIDSQKLTILILLVLYKLNYCCNFNSFSDRCKCTKKKLTAKLCNNFILVISIYLFHLDKKCQWKQQWRDCNREIKFYRTAKNRRTEKFNLHQ